MLLVIDVGNTNTVLGVFDGDDLRAHFRIETSRGRTGDEYAVLFRQLFELAGLPWPTATAGIVASVVPPVQHPIEALFADHLHITPLIVGPGMKTGMPVLCENPREVGADRIVNAVAAYDRWKQGGIVIDLGTATTFDVVSPRGEYLGGAIAPGIQISADALYRAAAKLPRVEIVRPQHVIGKNTITAMQSGLVYGYAGLVDAMVDRMRAEVDFPIRTIATGGLAPLLAKESRTIEETDELLTLRGLKLLYERNRG